MKRAKIEIKSTPEMYSPKMKHLKQKATMLMEMCHEILNHNTIKGVTAWIQYSKDWYGKYFVILVNDTLTVRDKKNIDRVILNIDLSEMEA